KEISEKSRRSPRVHSSPVARSIVPASIGMALKPGAARSVLDDAFQHLHFHHGAGRNVTLRFRQYDEAVGLRHGAQDAGTLLAGDAHAPVAGCVLAEDAALELGAARRLLEAARARYLESGKRGNRIAAAQLQQRIAHELIKGDHHRDGIARQPEKVRGADLAV